MHACSDQFTADQKARNFAYYERITVRDSSLSACTQAVLAVEVGHPRLAFDYIAEAALLDLLDFEHNTRDGLHIAALAGTWIGLVAGFGGARDHRGIMSFTPRLPDGLTGLSFTMVRRGIRVHVSIGARTARYELLDDGSLEIEHYGRPLTLRGTTPVEQPIPPAPEREPPEQPAGREPSRRGPGSGA
jgi:alpha,alpha-trehalose phosphorylase